VHRKGAMKRDKVGEFTFTAILGSKFGKRFKSTGNAKQLGRVWWNGVAFKIAIKVGNSIPVPKKPLLKEKTL